MTDYVCIGVPYFIGARIAKRTEVQAIRESGFADEIDAEWIDLAPEFNPQVDPVLAINQALAQTIRDHADKTPIIFASDCTSALGALKGLERQNPAVLWYDAHGDFNTHETTPSGFLGGMPLAMLAGRGQMYLMQGLKLAPTDESEIFLIDGRDLDPAEGQMVLDSPLTHLPEVNQLLHTDLPDKPIYIHFDTDVVDISEMPGMNYPAPDGPGLDACTDTLTQVSRTKQVAGLLFSLWNDSLPTDGRSLAGTLKLAHAFAENNG